MPRSAIRPVFPARLPNVGTPETVSDLREHLPERRLTLDEAIRSALESSKAIRLLAGETATPSGQTIYDATIVNTQIDQRRANSTPRCRCRTHGAKPTCRSPSP